MKRILAGLLVCLLALTACAVRDKAPETATLRATVLTADADELLVEPLPGSDALSSADRIVVPLAGLEDAPEAQPGDTVEITYGGTILESDPAQLGDVQRVAVLERAELPVQPAETEAAPAEPDEETGASGATEAADAPQRVEYAQDGVSMSLALPADWESAVWPAGAAAAECEPACSIDFWPKEAPELVFTLGWWPFFGMCGTGVTIEELTLENGTTAWQYTERSDGTVFLTVVFADTAGEGSYVIDASPTEAQWAQYADAFYSILETVACGAA